MNFDTFLISFTSIFNVLHGEDFQFIMYNADRAVGGASIIFFVSLVIFGQIILLNLLIAVLLENFEEKRHEMEIEKGPYKKK